MSTQLKSANEIIKRCKQLNRKIVGGGPLFTEDPDNFTDVDHLVLNEAEITLPQLVNDIQNGSAQTTDVETETNGLMTYDREIIKFDVEEAFKINTNY